jgi:hypothetical protein
MENSFLSILGFAFIPVITAIAGALIATIRPPSPVVRSDIQHSGFLIFLLLGMVE